MTRPWGFTAAGVALAAVLFASGGRQAPETPATFAARVAELSEAGGYFDTDNLISNERGYLQVLPALERAGVKAGAYVGVGPDQNFSYIAAIRPELAVILDIRRDNLLLHLLFKAIFSMSRTRLDYLALLTGRPMPESVDSWRAAGVDVVADYVDTTPADRAALPALRRRVASVVQAFDVPLSPTDLATIARFHDRFINEGLSLQFNTAGRAPQWHYPTLRDLVLADDGAGHQANYLASEDDFQFLKDLQARDRIIPVVGDLAGATAMRAVAAFLRSEDIPLSALYASNVEFYLWRSGRYTSFLDNLAAFPRADHAVIIRSTFDRGGSLSEIAPIAHMIDGR